MWLHFSVFIAQLRVLRYGSFSSCDLLCELHGEWEIERERARERGGRFENMKKMEAKSDCKLLVHFILMNLIDLFVGAQLAICSSYYLFKDGLHSTIKTMFACENYDRYSFNSTYKVCRWWISVRSLLAKKKRKKNEIPKQNQQQQQHKNGSRCFFFLHKMYQANWIYKEIVNTKFIWVKNNEQALNS